MKKGARDPPGSNGKKTIEIERMEEKRVALRTRPPAQLPQTRVVGGKQAGGRAIHPADNHLAVPRGGVSNTRSTGAGSQNRENQLEMPTKRKRGHESPGAQQEKRRSTFL